MIDERIETFKTWPNQNQYKIFEYSIRVSFQGSHHTEGTSHGGDTIQRGYTWDMYMEETYTRKGHIH